MERLAKFIVQHSKICSSQFIVISLRREFYENVNCLIGTYFDEDGHSNAILISQNKKEEVRENEIEFESLEY